MGTIETFGKNGKNFYRNLDESREISIGTIGAIETIGTMGYMGNIRTKRAKGNLGTTYGNSRNYGHYWK